MEKERNKYEKANEKIFDKVQKIWFVIGITFFIFFIKPFEDKLPYWNNKMLEEEHVGIVSKKYMDKRNHSDETIELKNNPNKINLSYFRKYYHIIEIGDSISKIKSDSTFQIFKKNEIIDFIYQMK